MSDVLFFDGGFVFVCSFWTCTEMQNVVEKFKNDLNKTILFHSDHYCPRNVPKQNFSN